jgi:hypothetical protein
MSDFRIVSAAVSLTDHEAIRRIAFEQNKSRSEIVRLLMDGDKATAERYSVLRKTISPPAENISPAIENITEQPL